MSPCRCKRNIKVARNGESEGPFFKKEHDSGRSFFSPVPVNVAQAQFVPARGQNQMSRPIEIAMKREPALQAKSIASSDKQKGFEEGEEGIKVKETTAPVIDFAVESVGVMPDSGIEGKTKCPAPKAASESFPVRKASKARITAMTACTWGITYPDPLKVKTKTCKDGAKWRLRVKKVTSKIRKFSRLLAGQREPTTGNTSSARFCPQVTQLNSLGTCAGKWYMLKAVKAHEKVHVKEWKDSFPTDWPAVKTKIEGIDVAATGATKSKKKATKSMRNSATFKNAIKTGSAAGNFPTFWAIADPNANTNAAERTVVNPRIKQICKRAKKKKWTPGACPVCVAKGIT